MSEKSRQRLAFGLLILSLGLMVGALWGATPQEVRAMLDHSLGRCEEHR